MASPTPGYCTFTATSRPSRVTARCTCPMLAAATGTACQSRNTFCGAAPSSARTTAAAASGAIGGASDCSALKACWASGGSASTTKLSSCPNFISAPFMLPSSRATSFAVRIANSLSSASWRER